MAAPNVLSVSPGDQSTDVVLGTPIQVTFDQAIDTTTISDATFSLSGPGQTEIITAQGMSTLNRLPATGREYIPGTFGFTTNTSGATVVTFTPAHPLRENVTYNVMIAGGGGLLTTAGVKNPGGEEMVNLGLSVLGRNKRLARGRSRSPAGTHVGIERPRRMPLVNRPGMSGQVVWLPTTKTKTLVMIAGCQLRLI